MSVLKFKGRRYERKSNPHGLSPDADTRPIEVLSSSPKDNGMGIANVRTDFLKQSPVLAKRRLSRTPLYIAMIGILGSVIGLGVYLKQSQAASKSREALYQLSIRVEDSKAQPVAGALIFKDNKRLGQTNEKGNWSRSVKAISNAEMEFRIIHDKLAKGPIASRLAVYFPKWSKNVANISKTVQLDFDQSTLDAELAQTDYAASDSADSAASDSGNLPSDYSKSDTAGVSPGSGVDRLKVADATAKSQTPTENHAQNGGHPPAAIEMPVGQKKSPAVSISSDTERKLAQESMSQDSAKKEIDRNIAAEKKSLEIQNQKDKDRNTLENNSNQEPSTQAVSSKSNPGNLISPPKQNGPIILPMNQSQSALNADKSIGSEAHAKSGKTDGKDATLQSVNSGSNSEVAVLPRLEVKALNMAPASPYNNSQGTAELVEGMKVKLKTYGIKTEAGAPFLITLKNLTARTGDQDEDLIEVTTYHQGKMTGRILRNYQKSIPFTVRSILWGVRLAYPSEYLVSKNKDSMTAQQPFADGNIWNLFEGMLLVDSKGVFAKVATIPGNNKSVKITSSGQFCSSESSCKVKLVKSAPRVSGWKKHSLLVKGGAGRKLDFYAAGIPLEKSGETHVYEGPTPGTTVLTAVEGEKIIFRTTLNNQENKVNTVVLPMPAISKR